MMQMIILDEDKEELDRFDFFRGNDDHPIEKIENTQDINEINKEVFNNLDYMVGVYSPIKNSDDFSITFLNSVLLNSISFDLDAVKDAKVSDVFLEYDKNKLLLNKMKEVYNTNIPQKFFFKYYMDDILNKNLSVTFTRIDDFLFILGKDETDYTFLSMEQEILFENDLSAIVIIQNGRFVKVNKKYLEVYGLNSYDEVIGQRVGYTGLDKDLISDLNKNIDKIVHGKMFSYSVPLEIEKDGKLIHYFNLSGSYIIYKGKPAVMVIHHDLTKEEINRRLIDKKTKEALVLQTNFDFIQSVSNIGVTYIINGKFIRSSKVYDIIERDPIESDSSRDFTWDYVLDEDKHIVTESYKILFSGEKSVDYIIRIRTDKGNLKYLHFYINSNHARNGTDLDVISFCQDVTDEQIYLKNLREALDESLKLTDNLNRIQSVSKTAIGYSETFGDSEWTPEVYDLLEIDPDDYVGDKDNLIERFVVDEDLKIRRRCIDAISPKRPDIKFNQRIKTGKGNIKYIKTVMHHEFDKDQLLSQVSFNQDITRETIYEKKLESALKDREILLSEVHHRVKNNLQIILSLINLNMNYNKSPEQILSNTQDRIYSMALIHEKIYGSNSLSAVNMKDYTKSLVESIFEMYECNIEFHSTMESFDLDMEQAIPLGLIINELVNNTIKYAFPNNNKGNLYVGFKKNGNHYTFTFEDDGIGLPDNFDLNNLTSLGLIVVQNLTLQINGTLSIKECNGTGFKIEFDE